MNGFMKNIIRLLSLAAAVILSGCGKDPVPAGPVPVESITVDPKEISMYPGDTHPFTVTVLPENAEDKTYDVRVNNKRVIKLEDGNIVALADGRATITVTTPGGLSAKCVVTVNKASDLPTSFTFDAEATNSSVSVKVSASTDVPFYFDICTKEVYESYDSEEALVGESIAMLQETLAYYLELGYDATFDHFLSIGEGSYTFGGLMEETEYYLYAYVVDPEAQTGSQLSVFPVSTKAFEPTDDCSFNISFEHVSFSSFNIKVEPTNNSTRYYVGLLHNSALDRYQSASQLADYFISAENENGMDWEGYNLIFTGTRSINSLLELESMILTPGDDYSVVVFGVNGRGQRTTHVAIASVTTASELTSDMTFKVVTESINGNGGTFTITPSDLTQNYYVEVIPKYMFDAIGTEESAAELYLAQHIVWGDMADYLYKGEQTINIDSCEPFTSYMFIICGYDGIRTTHVKTHTFMPVD